MSSEPLPLSALLSKALVGFTIELDNEFEARMPHRTADHGGDGPVWLASYEMWANFLRFVGEDGIPVRELLSRPGARKHAVGGMRRWRYVVVKPDGIVQLRAGGRAAAAVWRELPGEIEARWRARFGGGAIDALSEVVEQLPGGLPHYLPGGRYQGCVEPSPPADAPDRDDLDLAARLSQPLLVFTLDYERTAKISLAMAANVLRIADGRDGVLVKDMPGRSGIAKVSIDNLIGRLEKHGVVTIERSGRLRLVRLTERGARAKAAYAPRCARVEEAWRARYGERAVAELRKALERIEPELWSGLAPPPNGWRASTRQPETLPHYPLVTHRGGYPDGS